MAAFPMKLLRLAGLVASASLLMAMAETTSSVSDSVCNNGIPGVQYKEVCCLSSCEICGGVGCGTRPGGQDGCCALTIRDKEVMCDDSGAAPCLLTMDDSPAPVTTIMSTPSPSGGAADSTATPTAASIRDTATSGDIEDTSSPTAVDVDSGVDDLGTASPTAGSRGGDFGYDDETASPSMAGTGDDASSTSYYSDTGSPTAAPSSITSPAPTSVSVAPTGSPTFFLSATPTATPTAVPTPIPLADTPAPTSGSREITSDDDLLDGVSGASVIFTAINGRLSCIGVLGASVLGAAATTTAAVLF